MPRTDRSLTLDRVVEAAAILADRDGLDAVRLSSVAREVGVRTPSLYHHVDGLDGLRAALRRRGLADLADRVRSAATGRAGRDALTAVGRAYLAYARERPGLYGATVAAQTEHDDEATRQYADDVLRTTLAVLRGYELAEDDAVHAARFVRSTLHGFATLQQAAGFGLPQDATETVERLLVAIDAGLATYRPHGTAG